MRNQEQYIEGVKYTVEDGPIKKSRKRRWYNNLSDSDKIMMAYLGTRIVVGTAVKVALKRGRI